MSKTFAIIIWLTTAVATASSVNLTPLENTIEKNVNNTTNHGEDLDDALRDHNNDTQEDRTEGDHQQHTETESSVTVEDKQTENYQHLETTTEATITIESKDENETDFITNHNFTTVSTESYTNSTNSDEIFQENETVSVKEPDYNVTMEPGDDITIQRSAEYSADTTPIIQTTSGPVSGQQWHENENIISFLDVPYGVFSGLFKAPIPPEPLETVHEVSEHTKRCPQLQDDLQYVGDNDCLTLSIFTPYNAEKASVLFHIHGGNLVSGSGDPAIYGPEYLVSKGIILVLPNYRLGPLGFLCMQNDEIPGNAALKDLTLALNWTKENIESFGGNSSNIIVSGDGMSGAIAGYLALSPKSNHYINKVTIESGSVLSYLALDRNPLVTAEKLVSKLETHDRLNEVDTTKLLMAAKEIEFRPCLEKTDNAFLDQTPWAILNTTNIDITFMIGSAMYAGIHEAVYQTEESIKLMNEDYGMLLPNDLKFKSKKERTRLGEKVKKIYFGDNAIKSTDMNDLALCFTDAAYLGPGIRTARLLVEAGATVYLYEFSFVGEFNRELDSMNRPVDGAVKGDIVGYLFTQDGQLPTENSKEESMVNTLVHLWFNFMENGTPSTENIQWNRLDVGNDSDEEWLSIDTEMEMRTGLHVDRLKLWTEIYTNHFIEQNLAYELSPCACTVLIVQLIFLIEFYRNISHLY